MNTLVNVNDNMVVFRSKYGAIKSMEWLLLIDIIMLFLI